MRGLNQSRRRQRGLTLVELMVALALGLFLVGMVGMTYLQSASGTRSGALDSQMNEEGALALDILRTQLRLAGYSALDTNGKRVLKTLPLRGCDGGFTQASATGDFDKLACETGPGNSTIAVRYQATPFNTQAVNAMSPTDPGRPSNCANVEITQTPVGSGTAAIADNRFYIDTDNTNDNAPTLFCRGSEGLTMGDRAAIVPNVERLRLRYAITRTPVVGSVAPHQITAIVDAADIPGNDWTRVAAVELCVVMRTAKPVPRDGLSLTELSRYLDCDGTVNTSATDGRLRRAYHALVPLPNLRPGVPSPYETVNGTISNPYASLDAGGTAGNGTP